MLSPKTTFGSYEIVALLGSGGMGEVYRAHDTKLNREVALKVLPDTFTSDPDRLMRFKREAQVLASLNHQNIAAVYGFEETSAGSGIVLELVEGPTLADRIARGALPLEEALAIAKQIAEALEAAHEKGIVHRDLKPANVKVRPDGSVKVLDFGLAKAMETDTAARESALSMSPTIASPAMTSAGLILGTAAYMSPEQARGKAVDRRSDVWSFGCVLYEMLTGRRTFEAGETVSDAVAAILTREPDWTALPNRTQDRIRLLLRRCLQKDPRKRWRDLGDASLDIEEALAQPAGSGATGASHAPRSLSRRVAPPIVAAIVAGLLVGAAVWWLTPVPQQPLTRFALALPEGQRFTTTNRQIVAMSPDGSTMAYIANGALHLKSMTDLEARAIPGTEVVSGIANPTFSPDGRSIAYWSLGDRTIRRVAIAGGTPIAVTTTANFLFFGMSWDETGIVWGEGSQGIMRVPAEGGTPQRIASVKDGEVAHGPQILPGRNLLFTLAAGATSDRWDKAQIVVQSLTSGERKTVVQGGSDARYLPTGHLVYALGGTVFAVPFDLGRLQVSGTPTAVIEGVRRSLGGVTGATQFSVSNTGSLLYIPGPASTSAVQDLAVIDRTGAAQPLKFPPGTYEHPRVSPDGKRIVFGTDDGKDANVWVYELGGTSAMRRLTFGGRNRFPIWSADGEHVAFQSDRDRDLAIFWQPASGAGAAERLTTPAPGTSHVPGSWSSRSNVFVFEAIKTPSGEVSLWTFSLPDKKTTPVEGVEWQALTNAVLSPDGKWLAWSTNGVLVQPFPSTGAKYQVTPDRGIYPLWSRDGRELLYTPPGELHAVEIATQPSFVAGRPRSIPRGFLVNGTGTPRSYDVFPDGRFIGVIDSTLTGGNPAAQQVLVLNWFQELRQRVPTR
jgi:serine/threonine-protein kinase